MSQSVAVRRALSRWRALLITSLLLCCGAAPAAHAERSTLDSGGSQTCAGVAGGGVSCWGDFIPTEWPYPRPSSAPPEAAEFTPPVPSAVPPAAPAATVGAGDQAYQCALRPDATAVCWGWVVYFDSDYWPMYRIPPVVTVTDVPDGAPARFIDLAVNDREACGILVGGQVSCWRSGTLTRLTPIAGLADATSITSDGIAFCARRATGAVACWDRGLPRGTGPGGGPAVTWTDSATPADVPGVTNAISVSGRCALIDDGTVQCWSITSRPQTGQPAPQFSEPTTISGIADATDLSASTTHACVVLRDGHVACWGDNTNGQLGTRAVAASTTPLSVAAITSATDVSAGGGFTCVRLADASVRCWGNARFLGNPEAPKPWTPDPVTPVGDLSVAPSAEPRPGDLIVTPTPLPPTPTPTVTPTPTPTPEPTTPWSYRATGRAYLRTLTTGAVPLAGMLKGTLTDATGAFTGSLRLADTPANLQAARLLPIKAVIRFTEAAATTAQLTGGTLALTTSQTVSLRRVTLFGVNLVSGTCSTASPAKIALKGSAAALNGTGAVLNGAFALPSLTNCGALGAVISGLAAGSGNAATLTIAP